MQYEELQAAASGFTFANQLGEGGFGAVYRGEMKLGGGRMPVAIKVLDENSLQVRLEPFSAAAPAEVWPALQGTTSR